MHTSHVTYEHAKGNHLPMIGKSSDDGGKASDTSSRNTASDSNTVISNDTFSPDSTGRRNDSAATDDVNITGNNIVRR